jgi:hypothetical protein
MTGIEIVGSIALFWGLSVATYMLFRQNLDVRNIYLVRSLLEGKISDVKVKAERDDMDIIDRVSSLGLLVDKLKEDHDTITKLADETKKLLNQNTISNAFVHKNKRTELT